jgi:hypothetical protein
MAGVDLSAGCCAATKAGAQSRVAMKKMKVRWNFMPDSNWKTAVRTVHSLMH